MCQSRDRHSMWACKMVMSKMSLAGDGGGGAVFDTHEEVLGGSVKRDLLQCQKRPTTVSKV